MDLNILALAVVFLPLFSSALIGLTTRITKPITAHIISVSFMLCVAISSWILFYYSHAGDATVHIKLFNWFVSGELKADWSIYIDKLTSVMLIVVSTVSVLVHIYSIGYMSHDHSQQRFMSYLSLFTFFMLVLVSADNFAQLFVGWEGVGLSSYLLIGFWFHKKSAYSAAMKAFLVNRVGDIGLAIGIFLIAMHCGSIDYETVFSYAPYLSGAGVSFLGIDAEILTIICIALFIGCMGKSAQLGLHVWLPDAMEGPTPVSALIHAATMVTAGVFLLARCSYLFEYSELALNIVTLVGAITCIFAATVAIVQNDIKRIIAYSTCSQLGYMFFACGVSAYSAGVFHLVTHAFFKALLFLSAGSIIHAISDEQDIRRMGGIWRKLPYTHILMWVGTIALAGVPPLSGFFSKDLILEAAYASASSDFGKIAYWFGLLAAGMTAFYSCRLIFVVFYGKTSLESKVFASAHEAPISMMIPLIILGVGSLFVGYIGYSIMNVSHNEFWSESIFVMSQHNSIQRIDSIAHWVAQMPLVAAIGGVILAYIIYMVKPIIAKWMKEKLSYIYSFLSNKWYVDELYHFCFVKPTMNIGHFFGSIDRGVIDGVPNGVARIVMRISKATALLQTGYVYHYAMAVLVGIMILMYWYLPW